MVWTSALMVSDGSDASLSLTTGRPAMTERLPPVLAAERAGMLATTKSPNGNLTTFGYASDGAQSRGVFRKTAEELFKK